ncbi:MAG: hypothetical protein HKN43_08745 [Rhodothermales bacterium]|nr:hypothetical protein [Rhodothermales bacterium]
MRLFHHKKLLVPGAVMILAASALSCAPREIAVLQEPELVWTAADFERHIQALNSGGGAGQRAGTLQYAAASNHIVAQFRASGLRPGLNTFNVPFLIDRNLVSGFKVGGSHEDSLRVLPGVDTAPAAWTGTGQRTIRRFSSGIPSPNADLFQTAIVVDQKDATGDFFRRLNKLSAPTVFEIGDLSYEASSVRVDSAVAIQLTRETLARLLGISSFGVGSIINSPTGRIFNLRETLEISTTSTFYPRVQESNIIGVIPGKAPVYNSEVIVVIASIGSGGEFGGLPTYQFTDLGIGSSVLIEVSNRIAAESRYSAIPDRSIMFAHLYTGDSVKSGVEAFFRNPVWSTSSVSAMLLVAVSDEDAEIISTKAAARGISVELFNAVPPADLNRKGFLTRPRWVDHAANRSVSVDTIDRRILAAARDSAATQAFLLGDQVLDRLAELMNVSTAVPFLERNSDQE